MPLPISPRSADPALQPSPPAEPTPAQQLQALVSRAQRGERSAREQIAALLRAHPQLRSDTADLGSRAREMWIAAATENDVLAEQSLRIALDEQRELLLASVSSPLEVLLADQLLTGWLVQQVLCIQMAESLQRYGKEPGEIVRLQAQVATQQKQLLKALTEFRAQAARSGNSASPNGTARRSGRPARVAVSAEDTVSVGPALGGAAEAPHDRESPVGAAGRRQARTGRSTASHRP